MNTRLALFVFVWLLLCMPALGGGYDPTIFPSYQKLPLKARLWFESISRFANPGYEQELASVPEAEPALVELMKYIIADPEGDYEHLVDVIVSLRVRDDFSAEHQAWLRELLLSKLGRTLNPKEDYLKSYGFDILRKYPSPENEDLMIQYLKDKDAYNAVPEYDVGNSGAGVDGLKVIGTARAIGPLREYLKRFPPGANNHEVHEAIAAIEEREKQRTTAQAPKSAAINSKAAPKGEPSQAIEPKAAEHDGNLMIGAIVALSLLALGWLTVRKWRRVP